jgi:hypothetical protein
MNLVSYATYSYRRLKVRQKTTVAKTTTNENTLKTGTAGQ